ncbi:Selenide, water dikinase [subsurface metagenome]
MMLSNQQITKIIHSHDYYSTVHAMTDVTGFGFASHLGEMLINSNLGANISKLPVFPKTPALDEDFSYGIIEGCGAEISGPMLLSIDEASFQDFTRSLTDEHVWWFDVGTISSQVNEVVFTDTFEYHEADTF